MTIWEIIALAKAEDGSAKSMLHFKGSVLNESALPESGDDGDTYLVDSADSYFAWDGEGWTDVGQLLSMDDVAALFDQVEDAGDEQVARIVAKGQEVEESIPEDYSELSGDVGALKSAVTQVKKASEEEIGLLDLLNGSVLNIHDFIFTMQANTTKRAETIITPNYNRLKIQCLAGYQFSGYIYNSSGTAIDSFSWTTSKVLPETTYSVKIVAKKVVSGSDVDITDLVELHDAFSITLPITSIYDKADLILVTGGNVTFDFSDKLYTGNSRINIYENTDYSNITVSCDNPDYYFFVYILDEAGNTVATSVTWQNNTQWSYKRAYRIRVTLKIGTAGTDTFSASDVEALESDLLIIGNYPSLIEGQEKHDRVYVATNGNDITGDGTEAHPYKTIGRALSESTSIVIGAGEYTESISITGKEHVSIVANPTKANNTDTVKISTTQNTVLSITKCEHVYIDGIIFDGALSDVVVINECADVLIQNCEFNNSANANGLNINKTDGIIVSCKANNNNNDGFNIHYYGNTNFYNCCGKGNSGDGISHHESCTGSVVGGYWDNNGKAGISTPTYGANVQISDAICSGNQYGMQVFGGDNVAENTVHIKVSNVVFLNNGIGTNGAGIQVDKYIVDLVNCVFAGNAQNTSVVSGTVNQYNSGS